ncbi:rhomboid family protein [Primorskyibacter sedentarius]|uniref:Rhomboid family protein n=1 Tax=Primorskyibacter sedentarius TaxID=745311 RepID=A0A4R3J5E2_9RHOB|nr:rhomboid family intramembrane serine protease [Primorskyibacter sedentarius]TCS60036.1 rhomboid family protein [Primorskyibacter sedentarius]
MAHPDDSSPVNPLPPVIVALALFIIGIEAAFSLGARGILGGPDAVGWRLAAVQRFGFSGEVLDWMMATGQYPLQHVIRFVTYPFVHASFTHVLFASVMLLALGKMVGEVIGNLRTLVIFVISGIDGALSYALFLDTGAPLIGAFPPVYGMIGAFTYLLWLRLGQMGGSQIRAFNLIGILLGVQLVFGLLFGASDDWVADLGGFATGFVLIVFLVPGGWARILRKLRQQD